MHYRLSLLLTSFFLLSTLNSFADILYLHGGRKVHGTFLGGDSRTVQFLHEDGQVESFALILYRSRSATLPSKDVLDVSIQISKPLYVKRVDLVQGEGKSPYWMLVLSDAVVRNRTKSRVSLMFELHCTFKDGRHCEISERSDLDAFIKTAESSHQFLTGPVGLDNSAHAEGDLCFGYAEFPPTREGPGLETSHSQLVVLDRLSGRKAVLDVQSLVGTG